MCKYLFTMDHRRDNRYHAVPLKRMGRPGRPGCCCRCIQCTCCFINFLFILLIIIIVAFLATVAIQAERNEHLSVESELPPFPPPASSHAFPSLRDVSSDTTVIPPDEEEALKLLAGGSADSQYTKLLKYLWRDTKGGSVSLDNKLIDMIINKLTTNQMLYKKYNNLTINKITTDKGTLENVNIQGLIEGMHRDGNALSIYNKSLHYQVPISLTNITLETIYKYNVAVIGNVRTYGKAHINKIKSFFRLTVKSTKIELDDFKILHIGHIKLLDFKFVNGLDWLFSWITEVTLNSRRSQFRKPIEESCKKLFHAALKNVTISRIADAITDKVRSFKLSG